RAGDLGAAAVGQVSARVLDARAQRLETLRRLVGGGALLARLPREPGPQKVAAAALDPRDVQKFKNVQEYTARQQSYQKSNALLPPPTALLPTPPRAGAMAA